MIQNFKKFIKDNHLFSKEDKVLLAVSGGKDSVLMTHLFDEAKFSFGIAHCNFNLRGKAANQDELFVKKLAQTLKVPFYHVQFDTKKIAQERGISIQMAARDLRYEWLTNIQSENNFQYLATAHHLNDSIETIIYNLTKGCGIRGLQGIPIQNELIIRPLLFAATSEIKGEVEKRHMTFREDLSNQETKYARNKIRHLILPQLETLNPAISNTFLNNIERFKDTLRLFEAAVTQFSIKNVTQEGELIFINKKALLTNKAKATLLYEITKPYGFSTTQLNNALDKKTQVGAVFNATNHRLLVDRTHFIISPSNPLFEEVIIHEKAWPVEVNLPEYKLSITPKEVGTFTFSKEKNHALLCATKIEFPLTIRSWKPGDYFHPLGMDGKRKKLKDFFLNEKFSLFEKEKTLLLFNNNGDIIWVIGKRIDERYKANESRDALELIIKNS